MDHFVLSTRGDFDLDKIVKHMPFFFFITYKPERAVHIDGKLVTMSFRQQGDNISVDLDKDISEESVSVLSERVAYCLGTNEEFSDFYTICEDDVFLSEHLDKIKGNRLLSSYTDFEALVSIICSQNVTFKQYKSMVKRIVDAYGEGLFFPSPGQILSDPSLLKSCGVGYRSDYIVNVARYMDGKDSVDDAYRLLEIKGIGQYSLDLFILFQKRMYDYLYMDSLIRKIVKDDYGTGITSDKEIRSFARSHWGRYKGLAEVYLQKFLYDN